MTAYYVFAMHILLMALYHGPVHADTVDVNSQIYMRLLSKLQQNIGGSGIVDELVITGLQIHRTNASVADSLTSYQRIGS
jgi:hypothetical protein